MTRSLPPVPQDRWNSFQLEELDRTGQGILASLDFELEAQRMLEGFQPLRPPPPPAPPDVPEDVARRQDTERYAAAPPVADIDSLEQEILGSLQPLPAPSFLPTASGEDPNAISAPLPPRYAPPPPRRPPSASASRR